MRLPPDWWKAFFFSSKISLSPYCRSDGYASFSFFLDLGWRYRQWESLLFPPLFLNQFTMSFLRSPLDRNLPLSTPPQKTTKNFFFFLCADSEIEPQHTSQRVMVLSLFLLSARTTFSLPPPGNTTSFLSRFLQSPTRRYRRPSR